MQTPIFPREPGSYVLELRLSQECEIAVGRLGTARFPAGWYYYAGSALSGLRPRLERHVRLDKRLHWHVDALREIADLASVSLIRSLERLECSVARTIASMAGAHVPLAGFGASDCRCATHLIGFRQRPALDLGVGWCQGLFVLVIADDAT